MDTLIALIIAFVIQYLLLPLAVVFVLGFFGIEIPFLVVVLIIFILTVLFK